MQIYKQTYSCFGAQNDQFSIHQQQHVGRNHILERIQLISTNGMKQTDAANTSHTRYNALEGHSSHELQSGQTALFACVAVRKRAYADIVDVEHVFRCVDEQKAAAYCHVGWYI